MFPSIDTKSAAKVADACGAVFAGLFPGKTPALMPRLFVDVEAMFSGRYMDCRASDTPYHDLEHTLQVTWCLVLLLAGRQRTGAEPKLTERQFELSVAAAMLHDTGYLKSRADIDGTGAKYTFTHVLRSCAVASSYLPTLGIVLAEVDGVLGAIRCTSPGVRIGELHFKTKVEGLVGCALSTADYLGQMSVSDYLEKLPRLYAEFNESDNFAGVPPEQRLYQSADELVARTPNFWRTTVLPKLNNELYGLYRFLADPYPDGPNHYMEAVERNIALVTAAVAAHTRQN